MVIILRNYLIILKIIKTIKGKGFSFSENNNDWHHTILTKSNFDKALKEIN